MTQNRDKYFLVRLTEIEKASLKTRAKKARLSLAQYVRCKVFDVPFETVLETMGVSREASNAKLKSTVA